MFKKILIANRGEIACRIIETARRLGVGTVAVYSEADRHALHVTMADEAVCLGPPKAQDSYLAVEKILAAVRTTGAEAVHPGYGFLSENADFAARLEKENIRFIGPPATAIRAMGSKSAAKALMTKAGVPLLPGYHGDEQTPERFLLEAEKIGYPVALKAVAGGGGKGIRIVGRKEDLREAFDLARRESLASFGNDALLLERFLERPRHVEVQIFADSHGNVVHLFDRDCSVQRRHQKVLEEAPAPDLPDAVRAAMAKAAMMAAQSVGYQGAGTVEFLYQDGQSYFMEMNTRLQVEHPVTEAITGLDLVEWQLRVAAGEKLPLAQDKIKASGHAVELRLCAEDPSRDFLPSIGRIAHINWPEGSVAYKRGPLRVDTGFRAGDSVSIYYDSLLAKIIVHADSRKTSIAAAIRALDDTSCVGLATNQPFLRAILGQADFADSSRLLTGLIAAHQDALCQKVPTDMAHWAAAAFVLRHGADDPAAGGQTVESEVWSDPWAALSGWRLGGMQEFALTLRHGDEKRDILLQQSQSRLFVRAGKEQAAWDSISLNGDGVVLQSAGQKRRFRFWHAGGQVALFADGQSYAFALDDGLVIDHAGDGATANDVRAPMPGTVTALYVAVGQEVKKGERLVSMEAMKMVHNLTAPKDGIIAEIRAKVGQQVAEHQALVAMGEA